MIDVTIGAGTVEDDIPIADVAVTRRIARDVVELQPPARGQCEKKREPRQHPFTITVSSRTGDMSAGL